MDVSSRKREAWKVKTRRGQAGHPKTPSSENECKIDSVAAAAAAAVPAGGPARAAGGTLLIIRNKQTQYEAQAGSSISGNIARYRTVCMWVRETW